MSEGEQPEESDGVDLSAYFAATELHNGRLEWLAEHIRRSECRIDPAVAKQILSMLDGSHQFLELRAVRRSDLPPAAKRQDTERFRDFDLAVAVARHDGFRRGHLRRACHVVGSQVGLSGDYVRKRVEKYRDDALRVVGSEALEAQYLDGKVDFLGDPILPQTSFEGEDIGE